MEKNEFLLLSDLIYQLHTAPSLNRVKTVLLQRIQAVVPCRYASILMVREHNGTITLEDPVCNPPSFEKAERQYLAYEHADRTNWILYAEESAVLQESELIGEQSRLSSPVYQACYSKYHIYDTLQMSIIFEKRPYAVLTLYRTGEEGAFSADHRIYLQTLGKHLNHIFARHMAAPVINPLVRVEELAQRHGLTGREREILGYVFQGRNNQEMLEALPITEHTLQKHLQNLYRKLGVSGRWDLLKLKGY